MQVLDSFFVSDYPPLYQYKPLAKIDRIISILKDLNIHHSLPAAFNDPFEAKFIVHQPKNKSELTKYLLRTSQVLSNDSRDNRRKFAKDKAEEFFKDGKLNQEYYDDFMLKKKSVQSNVGIACFCSNKDSLLLWAHYADSHRGICIEYDFTHTSTIGIVPLEVNYQNNYPSIDIFSKNRDGDDMLKYSLLTKHECWKYEGEHRSLKMNGAGTYKLDDRRQIKSLTFGARASQEDKDAVIKIIKDYGIDIELYQASLSASSYEIARTPMYI